MTVRSAYGVPASMEIYRKTARQLEAVGESAQTEPILFEFGEYDVYVEAPRPLRLVSQYSSVLSKLRRLIDEPGRVLDHYRITLANDVGLLIFDAINSTGELAATFEL